MEEDNVYQFTMKQSNGITITMQGNHENLLKVKQDFVSWVEACGWSENTINAYFDQEEV